MFSPLCLKSNEAQLWKQHTFDPGEGSAGVWLEQVLNHNSNWQKSIVKLPLSSNSTKFTLDLKVAQWLETRLVIFFCLRRLNIPIEELISDVDKMKIRLCEILNWMENQSHRKKSDRKNLQIQSFPKCKKKCLVKKCTQNIFLVWSLENISSAPTRQWKPHYTARF